ncbi:MAG: hypothetical protein G01um101429_1080, partial [Parcubacteria group bacterium Gr01-1014_29]
PKDTPFQAVPEFRAETIHVEARQGRTCASTFLEYGVRYLFLVLEKVPDTVFTYSYSYS